MRLLQPAGGDEETAGNGNMASEPLPFPARVPIGIAVAEHAGRFLIGLRGDGGPLPGYAEFPGGKCRPGESPAACAVRECAEETGLRVDVVELLWNRPYDYPHAQVDLHFFLCRPADPCDVAERHGDFHWVPLAQLRELRFPPANEPVIALLTNRALPEVAGRC